ncbi:unnamed protein product [Cuscuta campestris]|uniref:Uncharacterized protein n=1 Tax=Cuscuta campestris TaxID=132261 RepID=A0A484MVW9_9ASTE|nr:unnamed protein product [Cuscuta campestris]
MAPISSITSSSSTIDHTTSPQQKLRRVEAHNRELQELTGRQLDEVANLARMAGEADGEILRVKEENLKLMEDAELKEREFPGKACQWMEENLMEAARALTSSLERTMEGFRLLYREEHGKEMITQVGSYGFMSSQKRDREATHAILAERDPEFNAESFVGSWPPSRMKSPYLPSPWNEISPAASGYFCKTPNLKFPWIFYFCFHRIFDRYMTLFVNR